MLLPNACLVCRRPVEGPLCERCTSALSPPPVLPCPAGVDAAVALFAYDRQGAAVVAALKVGTGRAVAPRLGSALAAGVRAAPWGAVDLVTWVPTSAARRRARGYDQSRLLARHVAASLDLPCERTLRHLPGPPQTGRRRTERLAGPPLVARPARGAVRACAPGSRVLVVDDVRTTGTTLAVASSVLREAGVGHVVAATLAATPGRPPGLGAGPAGGSRADAPPTSYYRAALRSSEIATARVPEGSDVRPTGR